MDREEITVSNTENLLKIIESLTDEHYKLTIFKRNLVYVIQIED